MKKRVLLLLLFPLVVQAEIYKCTDNEQTVYSDSPCGTGEEIIDLHDLVQPTGARFSTDEMDALGQSLGKERKTKELSRSIKEQQRKIDNLVDNYTAKTKQLKAELRVLNDKKNTASWKAHPYKKEQYYDKKQILNDKIKELRQSYIVVKEKAYNRLYSLRADKRRLR
ncbi:MAG: DUF4124 domain-containing protein [Pseudomonadales bacterium]|nr:DUF4124 domain-containing protein [Pseudomonadales bacterium]